MNAFVSPSEIQLTRFEHGIIRRKVGQLIGRAGFNRNDRHSLVQDLTTRLIHSFQHFDSKKAHRKTFATTVVEREVAKILRFQQAEKRDYRRIRSLNVIVSSSDGFAELGATIGTDEYDARRGVATPDRNRQVELEHDVGAVLDSLPAELRELAEQLKSKSLSQIAREMDVPRYRLRCQLQFLREKFEAENLRLYL